RRIPIVSLGGDLADADLVMTPPAHPVQLALRLESLVRAAVSAEEFGLRRTTFDENGVRLALNEPDGPRRILAVGDPDPRFLALSNLLSARGVEMTAAFTPYTA